MYNSHVTHDIVGHIVYLRYRRWGTYDISIRHRRHPTYDFAFGDVVGQTYDILKIYHVVGPIFDVVGSTQLAILNVLAFTSYTISYVMML